MNYLKRFAILLLPLIMIACNDDDNLNTGTATVEFQSAEIEIKELTSSLNLPIVVKGENNGLIKVRIEMRTTTVVLKMTKTFSLPITI